MLPKLSQTIKLTYQRVEQNEIEIKETFSEKIMQLIINEKKKVKKKDNTSKGGRGERKDKTKKIIVYKI